MKQEIEDLLSKGLMRKAQESEGWGSPMFMVSKTNQAGEHSGFRAVFDFRAVNALSTSHKYPLPRIDTLLRKVSQGQVFSSLDLTSGFYQIGLDPRTQDLATVSTPWGRYSFVVPPMGLASTPSFFQESMDKLFFECQLLSTMNHPHIVKFFGMSRPPGPPGVVHIVTEFCASDLARTMCTPEQAGHQAAIP